MNYEPSGGFALTDETEQPSRRRRWIIAGVIAVLVLIAAFVMLRPGKPVPGGAAGGQQAEQLPPVTVAAPGNNVVDRTITGTGSLAARVDMPVGVAGEGGRVTAVLVQPGQWVGAGQVLATVDSSVQTQTANSLAAQIAVARADAKLAQANVDRAQALVGRGFVSKADLETKIATRDAAVARVRVAEASLAQQRAANSRLAIRAPAAGLVLTRSVEPGQIVSAGSGPLFRMAKGGEMELKAELSEGDIQSLSVGARAQVTPVGSTQTFNGRIWQISPVIDPQTRRGIVRIAIPYDKALRPGGFATASIYGGASTSPVLPNSAIQTDANGNYVYIVGKDDKVERRAIKTGEVSDRGVSVVSGLNGNERVVLSAGAFLSPGQKVKPILRKP
ncbi:MAG: efflux RND transporter periplasmic adaptor subunit [Proteobacteria bacterium]|nr:efflux RND transporter periplasmic adaptor subunit [Pseudomonadota bacterium]